VDSGLVLFFRPVVFCPRSFEGVEPHWEFFFLFFLNNVGSYARNRLLTPISLFSSRPFFAPFLFDVGFGDFFLCVFNAQFLMWKVWVGVSPQVH